MREEIAGGDPCIILSTSEMVTGGPIMTWLELLGQEPENTLIFVGYQAQGTLGRRIESGRREIPFSDRGSRSEQLTLRFDVESVSGFSGHADRNGLENFVGTMNPRPEEILCVHGDESSTDQLSSGLYQKFDVRTLAPKTWKPSDSIENLDSRVSTERVLVATSTILRGRKRKLFTPHDESSY